MQIGDKIQITYPIPTKPDEPQKDTRPLTYVGVFNGMADDNTPRIINAVNLHTQKKYNGIIGGYNPVSITLIKK